MKHIPFGTFVCFAALLFSCSDFFTTSLAGWARRDPSSLVPTVTSGNVAELAELAENDPDQSLALLKGIDASAADDPELQAAALQVAANASGLGAAILQHVDDIGNITEENAKGYVIDALNSLSNVVEAGGVLENILPDPTNADTTAWDAFVAVSSAEDLAMAAVVLLAGKARDSGDPENYIDTFPASPQPGSTEDIAKQLAEAARLKPSSDGFLEDILGGLNL
jgi:hypothetical protein